MTDKFCITTAIDYTNDIIHVGHIYQKVIADVFARYHRLIGKKVFFLTGTDEHGGKVEEAACQAGFSGKVKEFVDQIASSDRKEQESAGVSFDRFIRTTDEDHIKFALSFWQKVYDNGDIYPAEYDDIYCEGCEGYLYKSDLVDGKCPWHPNREIKTVKEKNYFFRWSKYTHFLKEHLTSHPEFVWPEERRKEILSFLNQGVQDIPISRAKVKWGIPVPGDPSQTIYVWFDALINYLSGAFKFWPADIHILGKDNLRWHAALWPAMLKSAGYELPKTILVNGFLTLNNQKISKSLGNIVKTSELVAQFGAEAVRYYLIASKPIETDGDINLEKIKETFNADLANGLGNLVARIAKLCEKSQMKFSESKNLTFTPTVREKIESYRLNEALGKIWENIAEENKRINEEKPWELGNEKLRIFLEKSVNTIRQIGFNIRPFLPQTSDKILNQYRGPEIKPGESLFPRL